MKVKCRFENVGKGRSSECLTRHDAIKAYGEVRI
jgi:hypothetical protein